MPRSNLKNQNASTIDLRKFAELLGYEFRDPEILQRAMTHRSAGSDSNEVLEFLGDSVLNYTVTSHLVGLYPDTKAGDLTKLRAKIVNNKDALSAVAESLNVVKHIRVGGGFQMENETAVKNLQANGVEALIGAIYLDGGIDAAIDFIKRNFKNLLSTSPLQELQDNKSKLQELTQLRFKSLPRYEVVEAGGDYNQPHIYVICKLNGVDKVFEGRAKTRKEAEQIAAEKAFQYCHSQ